MSQSPSPVAWKFLSCVLLVVGLAAFMQGRDMRAVLALLMALYTQREAHLGLVRRDYPAPTPRDPA